MVSDRIKNNKDLSPAEKAVGLYIISHKEECIYLSADELGKISYTSGSAVTRLSKKLGYEGFRQMKIDLAQELNEEQDQDSRNINVPFDKSDNLKTMINKIYHLNDSALKDTRNKIEIVDLEKIESYFRDVKNVYFYGAGTSFWLCRDCAEKFVRIGYKTVCMNTAMEMQYNLHSATKDTVAIFVSYSGRYKTWPKMIWELRKRGIRVITITGISDNPLSKEGNVNFVVGESEYSDKVASFYMRSSMMLVLDVIFATVFKMKYDENIAYIQDSVDLNHIVFGENE